MIIITVKSTWRLFGSFNLTRRSWVWPYLMFFTVSILCNLDVPNLVIDFCRYHMCCKVALISILLQMGLGSVCYTTTKEQENFLSRQNKLPGGNNHKSGQQCTVKTALDMQQRFYGTVSQMNSGR